LLGHDWGDAVRRVIRWLILLAFFGTIAGTGSYAGARFKAGQILGPNSPVEARTSTFAYEGVQDLAGKPRAWVFTYSRIRLEGVRRVRIVVSLTGKVLSVQPPDLERRLDLYRQSLMP
jgi:hypothetical protein